MTSLDPGALDADPAVQLRRALAAEKKRREDTDERMAFMGFAAGVEFSRRSGGLGDPPRSIAPLDDAALAPHVLDTDTGRPCLLASELDVVLPPLLPPNEVEPAGRARARMAQRELVFVGAQTRPRPAAHAWPVPDVAGVRAWRAPGASCLRLPAPFDSLAVRIDGVAERGGMRYAVVLAGPLAPNTASWEEDGPAARVAIRAHWHELFATRAFLDLAGLTWRLGGVVLVDGAGREAAFSEAGAKEWLALHYERAEIELIKAAT